MPGERIGGWQIMAGYLPGDADVDGDVDMDDFVLFKKGFGVGTTWGEGDFTGDGVVDITDFSHLRGNYGNISVIFADSSIEQAVREAVGVPFGPLMPEVVAGVTELSVVGGHVENLDGFQYLIGLQNLDLHNQDVSDLSALAGLTDLRVLDLSSNEISDLTPLAALTNVRELDLSGNQITELTALLAIGGFGPSDTVDVNNNPLTMEAITLQVPILAAGGLTVICDTVAIPFADAALEEAVRNATDTPAGPFVIEDIAKVTWLGPRGKHIADLQGIQYLVGLEKLDLNKNEVDHLTNLPLLEQLPNLFHLRLERCGITDVMPLAKLTGLTSLSLISQKIADIRPLAMLTGLTHLKLNHNDISDLSPLVSLTELEHLQVDDNPVGDLTPLAGLRNLQYLRMVGTNVSDLTPLANLTELWGLNASFCQVSDISPLWGLVNLRFLRLQNNQITDLAPLVANPGLGTGDMIEVGGNPLSPEALDVQIPLLTSRGVRVTV